MDMDAAVNQFQMDTPGKRVRWALKHTGITAIALAKKLGISRSAVSQWWQPVDPTSPERHYQQIADFIGCNVEWLRTGTGHPFPESAFNLTKRRPLAFMSDKKHSDVRLILTLGEVAAGMFLSVTEVNDLSFEREPSAYPPDLDYDVDKQYDLIVRGTSIDRFARDGDRVRCVSIHANIELQQGDYVHVERYRHERSEIENTIKRAFFVNGKWELRFDSNDARWKDQPALVVGSGEDEQVEIVGIAIWQFYPSPTRRRSR